MSLFLFGRSAAFRTFYTTSWYPFSAHIRLYLTGWLPFSIGDLLYLLLAAWLIAGIFHLFHYLWYFRREKNKAARLFLKFLFITGLLYGSFLWLWGFNYRYDRLHRAFGVERAHYDRDDLMQLCHWLAVQVNHYHLALQPEGNDSITAYLPIRQVFRRAPSYYETFSRYYPGLKYVRSSIKPSLFGYLLNYAGITGYFNPFTEEAQVNTTPPPVSLPFTACHEIAHQLGFAAEDDANFVGYLVAASAQDDYFRYSANFEVLPYALRELARRDTTLADSIYNKLLLPGVRKDYQTVENFYLKFRGPAHRMLNLFYDQYLRANEQEQGIQSYSQVVGLLMDYYRKSKAGSAAFRRTGDGKRDNEY